MHIKYTEEELRLAVSTCKSKGQVCRALNIPSSGQYFRRIQNDIDRWKIDTSHFMRIGGYFTRKYQLIEKQCPICNTTFVTTSGPKEQVTCSVGCSNSFFRTGKNNPNYKDIQDRAHEAQYRLICFKHYEQRCAICGWDLCVDVHHIDGNNKNNEPSNLIPLCPNHHVLTRMLRHKEQIEKLIKNIVSLRFPDTTT